MATPGCCNATVLLIADARALALGRPSLPWKPCGSRAGPGLVGSAWLYVAALWRSLPDIVWSVVCRRSSAKTTIRSFSCMKLAQSVSAGVESPHGTSALIAVSACTLSVTRPAPSDWNAAGVFGSMANDWLSVSSVTGALAQTLTLSFGRTLPSGS